MSAFLDPRIAAALERVGHDADARAAEIAELRRLPADLAEALIDTGVFRLWVAEAYGGLQSHPLALYEAIEHCAYFEGSLGWVVMVCGGSASTSGAVNACYRVGGGSTIWQGQPLQRVFQDMHVATQHGSVTAATLEVLGRMAFGLTTDTRNI